MFQFAHIPPSLPIDSAGGLQASPWRSCLIRNLGVHGLYAAPPERFAGLRVLLRSLAPRHPPRTLSHLCADVQALPLKGTDAPERAEHQRGVVCVLSVCVLLDALTILICIRTSTNLGVI